MPHSQQCVCVRVFICANFKLYVDKILYVYLAYVYHSAAHSTVLMLLPYT